MIVRDVGELLARKQRMTSADLARHFSTSEEVIDAMLGIWMRKGRVRKIEQGGCSGGCCGARAEAVYEWLPEGQIGLVHCCH